MEVQRVRHKTLAHPPLGRKDFSSGGLIHYSGCRVIFLFRKRFFLIADLKGLYWVTKSSIAKLLGRFKERERGNLSYLMIFPDKPLGLPPDLLGCSLCKGTGLGGCWVGPRCLQSLHWCLQLFRVWCVDNVSPVRSKVIVPHTVRPIP